MRGNFTKSLQVVAPLACVVDLTPQPLCERVVSCRHVKQRLKKMRLCSLYLKVCMSCHRVRHANAHLVLLICQHTQLACTYI